MFDVGFSELVLLAVIGLLVLGPKRLQVVAGQLGKWLGKARRTTAQLYRQLERETKLDEVVQRPVPHLQVVPRPAHPPATPPQPAAAPSTRTVRAVPDPPEPPQA